MRGKFKNKVLIFLSSSVCISCSLVVFISINNTNASKDEDVYAINFTSENNVLNAGGSTEDGSTIVKTNKNNPFVFDYNNVVSCANKWQKVNANGYFCTQSNELLDNKFHDMKTLTFNFGTAGLMFAIYFSKDGVFDGTYEWSRNYITKEGEQVIDAEGHPNYFFFRAGDTSIDINSLTITYGCSSQTDTSWDNAHGVNPFISQDGKTLTYGLYPQTYVATSTDETSELAKALNAKVESLGGINDEEFFWYNDEYYVKDTGNPRYDDTFTFSDEKTKIVKGTSYYFKCEPITWNIVSTGTNYIIDCSNILYAKRYGETYDGTKQKTDYQGNTDTVYANNYLYSDIRTWLNTSFYNKAFSIKDTARYIVSTEINGNSPTNAIDNVWIGSKDQYNNSGWYSNDQEREKKVSDFALSNYASMNDGSSYYRNGYYWTRSPCEGSSFNAWFVATFGGFSFFSVDCDDNGCSPTLTIKF